MRKLKIIFFNKEKNKLIFLQYKWLNLNEYTVNYYYYFDDKTSCMKKLDKKTYHHNTFFATDFRKKNMTAEKILLNFFMRHGAFAKARSFYKIAWSGLYYNLTFQNNGFFNTKYIFFETLGNIITSMKYWSIFKNLLNYFLIKIRPLFFLKGVSVLSKFRKKKKSLRINTYKSFISTVPEYKRLNFTTREFCLYVGSIGKHKFEDRLTIGLLNLIFLDKKSFLYKKKISCYRKVLNTYINKGFNTFL